MMRYECNDAQFPIPPLKTERRAAVATLIEKQAKDGNANVDANVDANSNGNDGKTIVSKFVRFDRADTTPSETGQITWRANVGNDVDGARRETFSSRRPGKKRDIFVAPIEGPWLLSRCPLSVVRKMLGTRGL
ncbi:hypothetical protein CCM_02462 [Cordyceps militaris CM01]|uniref:Uncharacterized protein n=1 Tax=Cordyceps militaris (strain CM01) TaxID=983644 RepID=G3J9W8_CORMM|nr:uncharacterized protein CCM_02462 [Cordyceps militaris CM01]EGX94191.1 hypothetical protein CCM_02462 [Cordyceps militaris CM01]